MIRKQGITVTVMVITVIILSILAGTITFSMYSTISSSRLSVWANEIMYIQDVVDEELNISSATDFTSDTITINVEGLTEDEQFEGETVTSDNTVELKILDLGKLRIISTRYGNLDTENDVYALSTETGRVYYVQGMEIENKIYYSLTDSLKSKYNLTSTSSELSSVVFVPSVIGYTNTPITVTVKVPNTYTNIVISTSDDTINISSQLEKDNAYEYTINTNNIAGNYTVTVSYNDGTQTLASKYAVNGYDVTAPVINAPKDENFVYKETDTQIIDYLINVTATDESGIRIMKYAIGTITEKDAEEYFSQNGTVITNGRINLDRTTTTYTIYAEDNAGNFSVLTFGKKGRVPNEWKDNVSYIQDGVPIPKGFIASEATGENTKNGGLVIYEGTEAVTDANVATAKRTRNQYVWVPVEDFSKFVRQNFGMVYTISNTLGENYWEVVLDTAINMPLSTQDTSYVTSTTLAEVQAMYESVKEYEGFYIARYEAGIDTQRTERGNAAADLPGIKEGTKVYSMMGKIPYTYIPWTWNNSMSEDTNGAVEVARKLYPNTNTNYGVVSTLIYGVQWDVTLQWWLDTNAVSIITKSTDYGNYNRHVINSANELNEGALVWDYSASSTGSYVEKRSNTLTYPKANGTSWALSTGALKAAKVNNIYDMAGNVMEMSMEGARCKHPYASRK